MIRKMKNRNRRIILKVYNPNKQKRVLQENTTVWSPEKLRRIEELLEELHYAKAHPEICHCFTNAEDFMRYFFGENWRTELGDDC